ncbi:MAG: AsmA family protein [Phaeodactylibacter sp.]|nr:AsmA family protein [Phaeodactylibacter sp.]
MNKYLKRFLVIFGIFILVVLLLSVAVAGIFGDTIGKKVLTEVQKSLKTELKVGDVDLALLRSFPKASVNLKEVALEDAFGGVLLNAEEISFRFGLLSLLASRVNIQSVVISEGELNIITDRNGKVNYDIAKPSETETPESSEETNLAISLQEARLKNMQLHYADHPNKQEVVTMVKDALFSGEFSSEKFKLASKADLKTRFVKLEDERMLVGKSLGYDAKIDVDLVKGVYTFDKVDLRLGKNTISADGVIEQQEAATLFDVYLKSDDGDIAGIIDLLPETYLKYIGGLSSTGNFFLEGRVDGKMSETEMPEITGAFGLKNGTIKSPNFEDALKEVSFEARFSNGPRRKNSSTTFELKGFKGYFNRELINMDLKVRNLDDPYIDFFLDGVIPMKSIHRALGSEYISSGHGEVEIKEVYIEGNYNDLIRTSRVTRAKTSGTVEFDDAGVVMNDRKLTIDRGALILDGNELTVRDVKIEGPDTEIVLTGSFKNLLPVLLADSINSKRAELEFSANLNAPKIDFDELIAMTTTPIEEGEVDQVTYDSIKTAETQKREWFTSFLDGAFNARIDSYNYNKIEGEAFNGKLTFENNEMLIQGDTKAMKGTLKLDGKLFFEDRPQLQARLETIDIDVEEFFRQTENFGQEILTNKHVSGRLNSKTAIFAYFDNAGNFLTNELIVFSGIGLNDGELKDFEMLEDFSSYVKIDDLKHIKFVNMTALLEINKGQLIIPSLFIQSNAMNLTLSGVHQFTNDFDYSMKINAGQVVANRFKRFNPEMEPIEAKRRGWFNLYFKIFGNLETFDYKMAKKDVKREFAQSEYVKTEIKRALIEAFGAIDLIEEPDDWADIPEYGDPSEEDDVEYLDGF